MRIVVPPCFRLFCLQTNYESNRLFSYDLDATDEDQEEFVRGLVMRFGPRCFFCNLKGYFKVGLHSILGFSSGREASPP